MQWTIHDTTEKDKKKHRQNRRVPFRAAGPLVICSGFSLNRPPPLPHRGYHSRYSDPLRAGRCGDRIPVEARFSAPVQTGLGAHPASCTMRTGSFQVVKRPGRVVEHPPPSSTDIRERIDLYSNSPSMPP